MASRVIHLAITDFISNGYEWLSYKDAMARLTWDSNKTTLYELHCRLLEDV